MSKKSASRIPANLIKSVSILAVAVSLGACSSDAVRFSDGFYTGAVPVQEVTALNNTSYQQSSYQGQVDSQAQYADGVDNTYTASVNRNSGQAQPVYSPMPPRIAQNNNTYNNSVQRQTLPAPASAGSANKLAAAQPSPQLQNTNTQQEGWTATGGTYVTLGEGENIYSLSKRYGVPANAIMQVNNIPDANSVAAGSRIIIPTYSYSKTAQVSAQGSSASAANIGNGSGFPMSIAPIPGTRPENVQVASIAPSMGQVSTSVSQSATYTVTAGDTLSSIARNAGTSVSAIRNLNGLASDNIRLGQKLRIPGGTGNNGNVQQVSLSQSKTTSGSISKIDSSSTATAPANTGVEALRWPVRGRVISSFGSNVGGKGNDGIDISVPRGSAVKAAENGVVIYAGDDLKEFGNTVLVRHGNGLVTVYGHLGKIDVKRGANVSRGQSIGVSGISGNAKQPQLHFEVRKNTSPVNPMTYLR